MIKYSKKQIEILLSRFMEGTSTLEEEDILRDYFLTENELPEEWSDYQEMFREFKTMESESQSTGTVGEKRWIPVILKHAAAILVLVVGIAGVVFLNKSEKQPTAVRTEKKVLQDSVPVPSTAPAKLLTQAQQPSVENVEKKETAKSKVSTEKVPAKEGSLKTIKQLEQENAQLKAQLETIQKEMDQIRKQVFITEMEARGFQAIYQEDGSIQFIRSDVKSMSVEL